MKKTQAPKDPSTQVLDLKAYEPDARRRGLAMHIMQEIYRAVEKLQGDFELLGPIGSYGDTLSDEEVLASLKAWNAANGPRYRTSGIGVFLAPDHKELATDLANALVEAHPDVMLWEYDGGLGRHAFRDREFAVDACREVILRRLLLRASGLTTERTENTERDQT